MLPAGVDTNTPSETSFLIKIFLLFFILKLAVCLLCLNKDTSLIAIADFFLLFFVKTFIDKGEIMVARSRRSSQKRSPQNEGRLPRNAAPIAVTITHIGGRGDGVAAAPGRRDHDAVPAVGVRRVL